MKGFCSPAVRGGAVAQQPLWIISYWAGDKKCDRLPRNLVLRANIVELINMPKQKSIWYLPLALGTSNYNNNDNNKNSWYIGPRKKLRS